VLDIILCLNPNFKKLDSVIVTRKEKDNMIVWNERLNADKRQKLKKLKPENTKMPPARQEDDQKGSKNDDKK
jgi:hypothetical protein